MVIEFSIRGKLPTKTIYLLKKLCYDELEIGAVCVLPDFVK